MASSLVGASTKANGNCFLLLPPYPWLPPPGGGGGGPSSRIRFRIGTRKAAVLPLPVCAQAIKSLRFRITGIAFFLKLFAAHALLRPQVAAHWHSEETLTGLAIGVGVLVPLSFLRLDRRIYIAAIFILAGGMLSKMAGSYPSLSEVLRLFDWPYGQLLHFTGLTLYLNEIWPLMATIFLFWYGWRQRQGAAL